MRQGERKRPRRWNAELVIEAIQGVAEENAIKPGDLAPTSGLLGPSICNAAVKWCGGLGNDQRMAGYEPNGIGASRAKKMRQREEERAPAPKPRLAIVRDPVVTAERKASLKRQAEREAKHLAGIRRTIKLYGPKAKAKMRGRSDFYGRLKDTKRDDYLAPPDLLHPHRHTRRIAS